MSNHEERDLFEQNDMIDQYCIECSLEIKSKNHIYKAFIPNQNKDYYCIKAYPYDSQKNIDDFTLEQSIIEKFAGQPFILPIIKSIPYSTPNEEVNDEGELEENELKYICNVTKFCDNLDLRDVYNKQIKTLPDEIGMRMKKIIFYQSLKILEYLHENKVVHHDIKLPNFLVKKYEPPENIELFLIDFEFANDLAKDSHIKRFCGTYHYIAPEIYLKKKHDFSVDIWSLGVMIYFIYNDKYPFTIEKSDNPTTIFKKIFSHSVDFETQLPNELEELILYMLQKNPKCRITASEALNSSFFDDVKNPVPPLVSETKQVVAQSVVNLETNDADQIEGIPSDGQFYTEI